MAETVKIDFINEEQVEITLPTGESFKRRIARKEEIEALPEEQLINQIRQVREELQEINSDISRANDPSPNQETYEHELNTRLYPRRRELENELGNLTQKLNTLFDKSGTTK